MKRMTAVAALSLVLAGHGTARAAGQPQCDPKQSAGVAASGQQQGTSASVEVKRQADAQKFESAGANTAAEACQEVSAPATGASPERKP